MTHVTGEWKRCMGFVPRPPHTHGVTLRADQGILNENLTTNRGSPPSKTGRWEPDPSNPDGMPYYFPLARSELGSTEVRRKRLQIALQVLQVHL